MLDVVSLRDIKGGAPVGRALGFQHPHGSREDEWARARIGGPDNGHMPWPELCSWKLVGCTTVSKPCQTRRTLSMWDAAPTKQKRQAEAHCGSWLMLFLDLPSLTGAFYAGNLREWSISSLIIIIPATPSNPPMPYAKRTSTRVHLNQDGPWTSTIPQGTWHLRNIR